MNKAELIRVMDQWAEEEKENACRAKALDDERGHSIALMKESMYRTMLKTLALKAPAKLAGTADEMTARAEKHMAAGDADSADRCIIQRSCIKRVIELLQKEEGDV